jgi:hypothetical protein
MLNIKQAGIVDTVRAVRSTTDEVMYLVAGIHMDFDQEYVNQYGSLQTREWDQILPVNSEINPGDVVTMVVSFNRPFGERFQLALDVGGPDAEGFDEDKPNG